MAEGTRVGTAVVDVATAVDTGQLLRQGQRAAAAFTKGFSNVIGVSLSTVESRALASVRALSAVASASSRSFQTVGAGARLAQSGINSVWEGLNKVGRAAATVGGVLPQALGHVSTAARVLSNEIGLSAFRLQMMGGVLSTVFTTPVLAAGTAITSLGVKTAMSLEGAQVALKALLPAGYDVVALLRRLSTFAASSPVLTIEQAENFARRLVGAGTPIAQTERILDSLNKTMITFGVSTAGAEEVLLGIQQIFQKGKVQSEELTRQISQQIPIWHLLSEASGLTQSELIALTESGKFTSEMFADMLIKIGQTPSIAKGAAEGVSTLQARLSIVFESFKQRVATEFLRFFPQIKMQLDRLLPVIEEFTVFVIHQIPTLIGLMARLVDTFFRLREEFSLLSKPTQGFIIQLAKVAPIVGPAFLAVGALASSLSAVLGILSFALAPVTVFTAVLGAGFVYLYRTSEDLREGLQIFADSFILAFRHEMPAASASFKYAILRELLPALQALAVAFGFTSWVQFGTYLGTTLPRLLTRAVESITSGIYVLAKAITFVSGEWSKLNDETQKSILRFTGIAVVVVPLLPLLASLAGGLAAIANTMAFLTSTRGLLLMGLVGLALGIKYLWETSETFRASILRFVTAFKISWAREMPGAIAIFKRAVVRDLVPALQVLARAFGFTGWVTFSEWLGTVLPKVLAGTVKLLAGAVTSISQGIRMLTAAWSGLSDETQKSILKILTIGVVLLPLLPIILALIPAVWSVTVALLGLAGAIGGGLLSLAGTLISVAAGFISLRGVLYGGGIAGLAAAAYAFYQLYQTSEKFRGNIASLQEGFLIFKSGFLDAFFARTIPAAHNLTGVVVHQLWPAIVRLAAAFGINTWQKFAYTFGTVLPRTLALAADSLSKALGYISRGISWVAGEWSALDAVTKENIKTMLKWATATAVVIFAANSIAGAILRVFAPWQLLVIGIIASSKYLWDSSATIRNGLLAFGKAFEISWARNAAPALRVFSDTIKNVLLPSLMNLLHAFGLPQFATFRSFMTWFGTQVPVLVGMAAEKLTWASAEIARALDGMAGRWRSLDETTQKNIAHLALLALVLTPIAPTLLNTAAAIARFVEFHPKLALFALALAGVAAGIKYLWDNSQSFREGILAFRDSFVESWGQHIPAAVDRVKAAFKNQLAPALAGLFSALGFDSAQDFGAWLGDRLPRLIAGGLDALTRGIGWVADGINFISPKVKDLIDWWKGLDEKTQDLYKNLAFLGAGALLLAPKLLPVLGLIKDIGLKMGAAVVHTLGLGASFLIAAMSAGPVTIALLVLGGVIAGLALLFVGLYASSEDFRESVGIFFAAFKLGSDLFVLPAIRDMKDAFNNDLLPALKGLASSLGFNSLQELAFYLGGTLAMSIAWVANQIRTTISLWAIMMDQMAQAISLGKVLFENWGNPVKQFTESLKVLSERSRITSAWVTADMRTIDEGSEETLSRNMGTYTEKFKEYLRQAGISTGTDLRDPLSANQEDISSRFRQLYGDADTQLNQLMGGAFGNTAAQSDNMAQLLGTSMADASSSIYGTSDASKILGADANSSFKDIATDAANQIAVRAVGSFAMLEGKIDHVVAQLKDLSYSVVPQTMGYVQTVIITVIDNVIRYFDFLVYKVKAAFNTLIEAVNFGVILPYRTVARIAPGMQMIDFIPYFAQGGYVQGPGTGTSDSILTRLSNGEFVMRAKAVNAWGLSTLQAMNDYSPSQVSMARPPAEGLGNNRGDQYITVNVGDEPIIKTAKIVVDANNRSMINAGYTGRR